MSQNRQRYHSSICATTKVSLLPDSHGNPANRPPLCIGCVLWRASQKCTSAHSFCSLFHVSHSLSFFFIFVPGIWNQVLSQIQQVKEQKCQSVLHLLSVSGASVIYNLYKHIRQRQKLFHWLCSTCLVHFVWLQFYRIWNFWSQFYLYWPISFWCIFKENELPGFYTVWMCISPCLVLCMCTMEISKQTISDSQFIWFCW